MFVGTKSVIIIIIIIIIIICTTLLIFCAITEKIERRFLCFLLLLQGNLLCSLLGLGYYREGGRRKRVFLGFGF